MTKQVKHSPVLTSVNLAGVCTTDHRYYFGRLCVGHPVLTRPRCTLVCADQQDNKRCLPNGVTLQWQLTGRAVQDSVTLQGLPLAATPRCGGYKSLGTHTQDTLHWDWLSSLHHRWQDSNKLVWQQPLTGGQHAANNNIGLVLTPVSKCLPQEFADPKLTTPTCLAVPELHQLQLPGHKYVSLPVYGTKTSGRSDSSLRCLVCYIQLFGTGVVNILATSLGCSAQPAA